MSELTHEEHKAWMAKLWEAIGPIKNCGGCLKAYSGERLRCVHCGSAQIISGGEALRKSVARDLRRERVRKERDPDVIDALRNLYRAQQRHKARRSKDE